MAKVNPSLNLNKHPRDIQNGSLVNAINVQLSKDNTTFTNEHSIIENEKINNTINGNIVGVITCSEELIIFSDNNSIFRYNESTNEIYECIHNYGYGGGEINGSFTYNTNNDLIIIFAEYGGNSKQPVKTINLGTWDDRKIFLNSAHLLPMIPEVIIPTISFNFTTELWYKGWNFIYIRYKINDTGDYTQWYNTNFNCIIDKSSDHVIVGGEVIKYGATGRPNEGYADILLPSVLARIKDYYSDKLDYCPKSISMNLYNLDTRYTDYQLACINIRKDKTNVYSTTDISISNKTIRLNTDTFCEKDINIDDLINIYINYYDAKCITNYKNRIYISNYDEDEIKDLTQFVKENCYFIPKKVCYVTNATGYLPNWDDAIWRDQFRTSEFESKNFQLTHTLYYNNRISDANTYDGGVPGYERNKPIVAQFNAQPVWWNERWYMMIYSQALFGEVIPVFNYSIEVNGRINERVFRTLSVDSTSTEYVGLNYIKYLDEISNVDGQYIDYEYTTSIFTYYHDINNEHNSYSVLKAPGTKVNLRANIGMPDKPLFSRTIGGKYELYFLDRNNNRIFHNANIHTYWYQGYICPFYNHDNNRSGLVNGNYLVTHVEGGSADYKGLGFNPLMFVVGAQDMTILQSPLSYFIMIGWIMDVDGKLYDNYTNDPDKQNYLNVGNDKFVLRNNDNRAIWIKFTENGEWFSTIMMNLIYVPKGHYCTGGDIYGGHFYYIGNILNQTKLRYSKVIKYNKLGDTGLIDSVETADFIIEEDKIKNYLGTYGNSDYLHGVECYKFDECWIKCRDNCSVDDYTNNNGPEIYHYNTAMIFNEEPNISLPLETIIKHTNLPDIKFTNNEIRLDSDDNSTYVLFSDILKKYKELGKLDDAINEFKFNKKENYISFYGSRSQIFNVSSSQMFEYELVNIDYNGNLSPGDGDIRLNITVKSGFHISYNAPQVQTISIYNSTNYSSASVIKNLTYNEFIIQQSQNINTNINIAELESDFHIYDDDNKDITEEIINAYDQLISEGSEESSDIKYKEMAINNAKFRTLIMDDKYGFYIHFVDKYGISTPGYPLLNKELLDNGEESNRMRSMMPSISGIVSEGFTGLEASEAYTSFLVGVKGEFSGGNGKLKSQLNWIDVVVNNIPDGYIGWYVSYNHEKIVNNIGIVEKTDIIIVTTVNSGTTTDNICMFESGQLGYYDNIKMSADNIRIACNIPEKYSDTTQVSNLCETVVGASSKNNIGRGAYIKLNKEACNAIIFSKRAETDTFEGPYQAILENRSYINNNKDKILIPCSNIFYNTGYFKLNNTNNKVNNTKEEFEGYPFDCGGYYNGFHTFVSTFRFSAPIDIATNGIAINIGNGSNASVPTNSYIKQYFTYWDDEIPNDYKQVNMEPIRLFVTCPTYLDSEKEAYMTTGGLASSSASQAVYLPAANSQDLYVMKHMTLNECYPNIVQNYRTDKRYKHRFNNRIIRTNIIQNESEVNSWRTCDFDKYIDVTENKGEINNIFGKSSQFFIHTKFSSYIIETQNSMKTTNGNEIQVKDKDVFDAGYKEIVSSKIGHAGLYNRNSYIIGDYGYIWYDDTECRFYIYKDRMISPIDGKIHEWIKKYKLYNVEFSEDIDNNRILISAKYGNNKDIVFSYNYNINEFVSLHEYKFNKGYDTKNKLYLIKDNKFYNFDEDTHSIFKMLDKEDINELIKDKTEEEIENIISNYNNKFRESKLSFMLNPQYDSIKFINFIIYKLFARTKNDNDIFITSPVEERTKSYSGNYIRIYNEFIDTGKINIEDWTNNPNDYTKPFRDLGNWNLNLIRDKKNIPLEIEDLTYDSEKNTYVKNDIKTNVSDGKDFESRLYGNYFIVEFYFTKLPEGIDKFEFEGFDCDLTLKRT